MPTPTVARVFVSATGAMFRFCIHALYRACLMVGVVAWTAVALVVAFAQSHAPAYSVTIGGGAALIAVICSVGLFVILRKCPFVREP